MRGREAKEQPHRVALGHDVLDDVHAVGERGAQVHAGLGPALAARIARQMEIAAADAVVVGRQHILLDLRHVLRALRLLEAQRHRFVAFEFGVRPGVGHGSFLSLVLVV